MRLNSQETVWSNYFFTLVICLASAIIFYGVIQILRKIITNINSESAQYSLITVIYIYIWDGVFTLILLFKAMSE